MFSLTLSRWLGKVSRRCGAAARPTFRPLVEALEAREVPALLAPTSYSTGAPAWNITTADLNNDGKLDLLWVSPTTGTVSVALGNGNGTFAAPRSFPAEANARALAVGDFNADGKLDVVTANATGTLSLLKGNGNGTFQAPTTITLSGGSGVQAYALAVGDMNGDGKPDLVVGAEGKPYTNHGITYQDALIYVLTGKGNGTFNAASPLHIQGDTPSETIAWTTPGLSPVNLALGDVNGDGKLDVVAATYRNFATIGNNPSGNRPIYLLPGDSRGGLSQGPMIGLAFESASLSLADFTGDRKLDLAVATTDAGGDGYVMFSVGNGNGTFQPTHYIGSSSGPFFSVAAVDLNHDGKLDLVVTRANYLGGSGTGIGVLLGNGDGTFQAMQTFGTGTSYAALEVGDFNGDGYSDVAAMDISGSLISILLNDKTW
jgi:hypothetical protein